MMLLPLKYFETLTFWNYF